MFHFKSLIVAALAVSLVESFSVDKPQVDTNSRRSLLMGGAAALVAGITVGSEPANAVLGKGTPVGREIGKFLP